MLASGDTDFLDEMQLTPAGGGRFRGELTNRFNAPVQPQGGITTALALLAAERALGRDDQTVRSLSTTFAAQVVAGPVDVEVEVLRAGRSASQVRSTVRSVGGDPAGHVVVATFVADRPGDIGFADGEPPDVQSPDAYPDRWEVEASAHPEMVGPRPTFFEHFEHRLVRGHVPWDPPWVPTSSEVVSWFRWRDTPRGADGRVSPLAIVPPCDTMPPAVFERHGPDERWYLVPSVDLVVQLFDTELTPGDWMLRRNRSRWAGHGLAAAEMEVFAEDGRPLAFATQLMHVRVADREMVMSRTRPSDAPAEPADT